MSRRFPLLFIALAFFAAPLSQLTGQEVSSPDEFPVELQSRTVPEGGAIELVIPKSATAGVLELYGAETLESLGSQPTTIQFTNAPTGGDLLWQIPVEQRVFYRALLRAGKTLEDYSIPDWDEPVGPTNQVPLIVGGVPEALTAGASYAATFVLIKPDGEIAPLAPTGKLKVLSWDTAQPHPDAAVLPETVVFTNGYAAVQVTIKAATSLDGYTLGMEWDGSPPIWPSTGIQRAGFAGGGNGNYALPTFRSDSQFNVRDLSDWGNAVLRELVMPYIDSDASWGPPLPGSPADGPEVNGSFGEWRGHKRDGVPNNNVHAGLDLKAVAGATVVASRGGMLTKNNGKADGRYVVVNHLDGTYSRYLHLQPWSPGDAKPGRVRRGDHLGRVGDPAGGPHLHFEIRRSPDQFIIGSNGLPGVGVDPVREAGLFRLARLTNLPILEAFQVVGEHPAKQFVPYAGASVGSPAVGGKAYVIVRIRQERSDGGGEGLSPKEVQLRWEGGAGPVGFGLADEEAVRKAKPAQSQGGQAGFAIYEHGRADSSTVGTFYRYWFEWDASGNASKPNGPRTLTLTSKSYAPQSVTVGWQVKWGPEIESVEPVGDVDADCKREYRIRVRYWRGHQAGGAAEPPLKGHDWYDYELSEGGVWVKGEGSKFKDSYGTVDKRELRFKMPVERGSNGWVKVSSGRVPFIADRKELESSYGCFEIDPKTITRRSASPFLISLRKRTADGVQDIPAKEVTWRSQAVAYPNYGDGLHFLYARPDGRLAMSVQGNYKLTPSWQGREIPVSASVTITDSLLEIHLRHAREMNPDTGNSGAVPISFDVSFQGQKLGTYPNNSRLLGNLSDYNGQRESAGGSSVFRVVLPSLASHSGMRVRDFVRKPCSFPSVSPK